MRRYKLGSLETDDIGLKSSQSLRHSEPSSSQMENSQCSSFDLFSQIMSQQQGHSSQPSEASQVAQKYYTKFASKPSLFRNSTGGKDTVIEKSGLSRQKSFQDLQEFQKQKVREKEGRDLVCTLISLLKESTDEIKHVVEKLQSDVHSQITSAAMKTEESLSKTQQCLQDHCKDMMQEVLDKLNDHQTIVETEKKLSEKEAVLDTLQSELERSRTVNYDNMKQLLQKICLDHFQTNNQEVQNLLQEVSTSWKSDQQKSLDEFCDTILGKLEDKLKDYLQHSTQTDNGDLAKHREGSNHQITESNLSESANISTSCEQAQQCRPYENECGTHAAYQSRYLPTAQPRPNAVHAQIKPSVTSATIAAQGSLPSDTGSLSSKDIYMDGKIRSSDSHFNFQTHTIPSEQRMTFSSPTLYQQSVVQASLPTSFARWGSKGPSPVAAVAPVMQETSQPVYPMNGQQSGVTRKQNRQREKKNSYIPPQRRSARLKERKVEAGRTQYPPPVPYLPEHKTLKRVGYVTKVKQKMQTRKTHHEIAQHSQRRSHIQHVYGQKNNQEIIPIPAKAGNFTGYIHSADGCGNISHHEHTLGPSVVTYGRVTDRDQCDGSLHTGEQFPSVCGSESDDSSSEETYLSAQHHGDVSSQDLFIDAIDDQLEEEEQEEQVSMSFFPQEDPKHPSTSTYHRGSGLTTEFTRAVKKKRTLWGSATPQKKDLISFLTSSMRRKTKVT